MRASVAAVEFEGKRIRSVKPWNTLDALTLLAKHLQLLTEKTEHQVAGGLDIRWLEPGEDPPR